MAKSRFSKKSKITLGKNSNRGDAKDLSEFIKNADHIDSSKDLSTAFPALKHGLSQKKDSSSNES